MPGNFIKEDLRVAKTYKGLQNAIASLLKRRRFKQLTVNDLCEEALISRAAFYIHFKDKYDLLESWFVSLLTEFNTDGIEDFICRLIYDNSKVMQNILYDADSEALELIHKFIRFLIDKFFKREGIKKETSEYSILSIFCDGGIYEIILYLLKNQSLQDSQTTQKYLHDLLENLFDFHINMITSKGTRKNEKCYYE